MDMKILKERDTPLMSRKRYTLEISEEGATPSRKQIRDMVAIKLKADPNLTIVKHVYPRYGLEKSRCIVNIYEKEEDMKRYEMEGLVKKHQSEKKQEAASEAPAPATEAPAEKPAEESKEATAEEKPAEAAE